jgi:lysophospholipase L1-like esterase
MQRRDDVTLIYGGICQYAKGSQLDEAVAFLKNHRGQVAFVTIDIGANDVLEPCYHDGRLDRGCTRQTLATVTSNVTHILRALHTAGGDPPIVGMTYYDAFLGLWNDGAGGHRLARYDERVMEILNAALTTTFHSARAQVADVQGFFASRDFEDRLQTAPHQPGTPINVLHACAWTWFCTLGDIHATTTGYGVIARAFKPALT